MGTYNRTKLVVKVRHKRSKKLRKEVFDRVGRQSWAGELGNKFYELYIDTDEFQFMLWFKGNVSKSWDIVEVKSDLFVWKPR